MKFSISEQEVSSIHRDLEKFFLVLEKHPVFKNPYFDCLQNLKWNKATFELHRANFFYRTELTVKAIAHVCARAAAEEDQDTLILFSYILNEECGNGSLKNCHAMLMEQAHNLYGKVEYSLEPLLIKDAKKHRFIIEETEQYRKRMYELITSSYQCMLGVVMALEYHANKMLTVCREAFRSNLQYLTSSEYSSKVEIYFNCHVDNGVEERHSSDAKLCVFNNCHSINDLQEIKYGAEEAMKVQLNMWNALAKKTTELAN